MKYKRKVQDSINYKDIYSITFHKNTKKHENKIHIEEEKSRLYGEKENTMHFPTTDNSKIFNFLVVLILFW